ncbi:MAG: hypothetical protein K8T90_17925 [Planctomycetes bacterium]|nr:hypothetical protein [Planctomycetota bacterium]
MMNMTANMAISVAGLLICLWGAVVGLWFQSARRVPGIAVPAVAAATTEAGRRALRRASGTAFLLTLAALGIAAALDRNGNEGAARAVLQATAMGGFHVVFWWGGAPLLRRQRAEAPATSSTPSLTQSAPTSVRVASLVVRDDQEILPTWWWTGPVVLVLLAPAAAVCATLGGVQLASRTWNILMIGSAVSVAFCLPWGAWAHMTRSVPQDLSGVRDPEALDRACRAFRRFLTRGIFGCLVVICFVVAGLGVGALATDGDPAAQSMWCAIFGGGGGSLAGLAGAALGLVADRHRRAILDLGGLPPELGVGAARRGVPATVARD